MPAHRMNMRMIKDVLRHKFDGGFSHDRIAASLGISKGVVTKYIGLAGDSFAKYEPPRESWRLVGLS
ncbi:hypothetical protein [Burkholderia sp. ABCPW 14]|uniref:hypothetical protein n=1 Tax=Burkholderia sp. ABCPW 14 TaxID=1637860 RepID=UPI0009EAE58B|nr:hypothetical protein [Burkholderia sp. ABCPW 14]